MSWIIICTGVLAVLLTAVFLFYRKRKSDHRIFNELGVEGPEPHWLFGSIRDLNSEGRNGYETLQLWSRKYGGLYGYYEGNIPVLVTSDPEFVREVFVKKFAQFHGRKKFPVQPGPDSSYTHMLLARGHKWKRLRLIVNPTFSSAKLRQMLPLVCRKVDTFVAKVSEVASSGESFNISEFYQRLTLDVMGDVAFGMDVDHQNNKDEPFLVQAQKLFNGLSISNRLFLMRLAEIFPELRPFLWKLFEFLKPVIKFSSFMIRNDLKRIVDARRLKPSNRVDLLQLMLDAEVDNLNPNDGMSAMSVTEEERGPKSNKTNAEPSNKSNMQKIDKLEKKLSNSEVLSQSILFLLAGYETTSTALSFVTYLLATHPDEQRKLQEEVDEHYKDDISLDDLQSMTYLHWVLCEALRLYPLGSNVVNRECAEACIVRGVTIPENMVIQVDVWSMHRDPDIWGSDADKFRPERFNKEEFSAIHPLAWIPFGGGPRNCIGLRFALMEAKMALVELLHKFTIETSQGDLAITEQTVIVPKDGVHVRLVQRNK